MTIQTDLETARDSIVAGAAKLSDIINGPASGAESLVTVDSGDVKTVARALAEIGDTANQALKDLSNVGNTDFATKAVAAGVGGDGDMIAANNLSDVADAEAARTNLGLEIGQDVQPYDVATVKSDTPDTLTVGFAQTAHPNGNLGAAFTPDIAHGAMQTGTINSNITISKPADTCVMELLLTNDGTGGYTVTVSDFTQVSGTYDDAASAKHLFRITKYDASNVVLEVVPVVAV